MSHPFKPYEIDALRLLLADAFSEARVDELLERATSQDVQYTGYGFYVSISNPAIGKTRRVFGPIEGRSGERVPGFVVFLENDRLTLETFPWDAGGSLPSTFRDSDVHVRSFSE